MRGYIPCGACGYEGPNAGHMPRVRQDAGKTEIPVQTKVHEMPRRAFRCSDVVLKKSQPERCATYTAFAPTNPTTYSPRKSCIDGQQGHTPCHRKNTRQGLFI